MYFLRTLFWIVIAVMITIFAKSNWHDVTFNLWGGIQADIKLPLLLALMFAIGFLPPFLLLRARLWTARKRLDALERDRAAMASANETDPAEDSPVI